jgi:hypothetical protein
VDDKRMHTKENQQLDKTQRIEKLENANYKTAAKNGYRYFFEAFSGL